MISANPNPKLGGPEFSCFPSLNLMFQLLKRRRILAFRGCATSDFAGRTYFVWKGVSQHLWGSIGDSCQPHWDPISTLSTLALETVIFYSLKMFQLYNVYLNLGGSFVSLVSALNWFWAGFTKPSSIIS